MNPKRYFDNRELRFEITLPEKDDPILVICPKCHAKALILPDTEETIKCVCTKCSFNKHESKKRLWLGCHLDISYSEYLCLNLWLETHCCGHSLYAFTIRHLDLIESYIKADLRERKQNENGWRNASVASRLPKWIKSHKNREQLIKSIQKLREKS